MFTAPAVHNATFFAESWMLLTWTRSTTTTPPASISIHALARGSFTITQTLVTGIASTALQFNWTIPSTLTGQFWFAATPFNQGSIVGHAPPRLVSFGDRWINIVRATCANHDQCAGDKYCDIKNTCWVCGYCDVLDSVDGRCPVKCGGTGTTAFTLDQRTPDDGSAATNAVQDEIRAVGAVSDVIRPGCSRYNQLVVSTNANITFAATTATSEPRRMTRRLRDKLDMLATLTLARGWGQLIVQEAYLVPPATVAVPVLLQYEGRGARIAVSNAALLGDLAQLALSADFDFIHYASTSFVYVSVIPDPCQKPLDVVFLLDSSGSIEMPSFGGAPGFFRNFTVGFVREVVSRFDIGFNQTRVGIVQFSDIVRVETRLDSFYDKTALLDFINNPTNIPFLNSATRTSLGLNTTRVTSFNELNGMRPLSAGVTRILVRRSDEREKINGRSACHTHLHPWYPPLLFPFLFLFLFLSFLFFFNNKKRL